VLSLGNQGSIPYANALAQTEIDLLTKCSQLQISQVLDNISGLC